MRSLIGLVEVAVSGAIDRALPEFAFREIYRRLDVLLEPEDSDGESFYNALLPDVTSDLTSAGIAVESDGALVVFSEEVSGPDGDPVTLMVRKQDGGYGYDTTDLATIRYRIRDLKADRILYVVDARQSLHFRLIFERPMPSATSSPKSAGPWNRTDCAVSCTTWRKPSPTSTRPARCSRRQTRSVPIAWHCAS